MKSFSASIKFSSYGPNFLLDLVRTEQYNDRCEMRSLGSVPVH